MEIYHTKRQKCRTRHAAHILIRARAGTGRDSFKVNSPLLLFQEAENVSWLSSRKLEAQAAKKNCELDEAVEAAITQDVMRAVNRLHPDFETILAEKPQKTKKRVHVLAIGDVGSTLLTGLHLLGGDCISRSASVIFPIK